MKYASNHTPHHEAIHWLSITEGGSISQQQHKYFLHWLNKDNSHVLAYREARRLWHSSKITSISQKFSKSTNNNNLVKIYTQKLHNRKSKHGYQDSTFTALVLVILKKLYRLTLWQGRNTKHNKQDSEKQDLLKDRTYY